jgi:hypothetical protein
MPENIKEVHTMPRIKYPPVPPEIPPVLKKMGGRKTKFIIKSVIFNTRLCFLVNCAAKNIADMIRDNIKLNRIAVHGMDIIFSTTVDTNPVTLPPIRNIFANLSSKGRVSEIYFL